MWKSGNHRPLILLSIEDGEIKDNQLIQPRRRGDYGKLLNGLLASTGLEGIQLCIFSGKTEAKNVLSDVDPDLLICFGAKACSEAGISGWKDKNMKGVVEITHKGKALKDVIRVAVLLPKLAHIHGSLEKDYDKKQGKYLRGSQTHQVVKHLKEAKQYIDYVQQFKD